MVNTSNFSRDTSPKYSNRKFKSTNGKGETPLVTGTKNAKSEKILINCTFIYDMYVVLLIFFLPMLYVPVNIFSLMSGRFPSGVSFELATYHAVDTRLLCKVLSQITVYSFNCTMNLSKNTTFVGGLMFDAYLWLGPLWLN